LVLAGGHPALDLVNTRDRWGVPAGQEPEDHLTDPDALLAWARRADVVTGAEAEAVAAAWGQDPGSGAAAVDATNDVREALYACLVTAIGAEPYDPGTQASALERLRCRWSAAAGRSTLVFEPDSPHVARLVMGVVPAQLVPDRLAAAALDLLQTADLTRIRRCPTDAGGCGWLFLDRTRNRSRRWCRMEDCGTEVKTRRLTERRRAARNSTST